MRGKLVHELELLVWVSVWGWVRVMVEFGTSSAFRGWVRVRVLGYGFGVSCLGTPGFVVDRGRAARQGVRGRKVKSRDCALASDLVRAASRSSTYKLMVKTLPDVVWPARCRQLPAAAGRAHSAWHGSSRPTGKCENGPYRQWSGKKLSYENVIVAQKQYFN